MPPGAIERVGGPPLWAQVRADLRRRAEDGEFPEVFPGELELTAQYDVSRTTVREALRALRAEGVVTAERGRPSRVVTDRSLTQPVGALYSLFASVRAAGLSQRSIVRRLDRRADGVVAARLGLEESTPLVHLERLRLAGEEPLALDRVWLPAALAAPPLDVDFSHTSVYDELAARTGVRPIEGEERIRALMPGRVERAVLEVPPHAAVFAIDRLGRDGERRVEWRTTVVRGDRFVLRAGFSATGYHVTVGTS
ncbi:GntR family transcriptional regulator [Actinomycetospora sp. NBRC 106378]|nr:GntR family transcriptional regulator [Actinomycetospora sp. NBRC 106378]